MSITPQALQDLLDELEASKQSRRRAWAALQRLREALRDLGKMNSLPDPKKSFKAEGAVLERALKLCLEKRARAIRELTEAARQVDHAAFHKEDNFGQAHQRLLKALDQAEEFMET